MPPVAWDADRPAEVIGEGTVPKASPARQSRDAYLPMRCFLGLLRISALTSDGARGCGTGDILHTATAVILNTSLGVVTIMLSFLAGVSELSQGRSMVHAIAKSNFFGLMFLLMWVSLMFCYVVGRRRFGRLLHRVGRRLDDMLDLPGYWESVRILRQEVTWLLVVAFVMALATAAASFYMINIHRNNCATPTLCVMMQLYGAAFEAFYISFILNTLKFIYAGLQVNCGFRAINISLEDFVNKKSEHASGTLDQLMAMQDDLAQFFVSITSAMSYELVSVMACGTVASVSMWLVPILYASTDTMAAMWPMLLLYVLGSTIAVVLPCELIERMVLTLARTRNLLLVTERRQPLLGQQLSLFRETVGRDLESLGDLGFFKMRRSTILSTSATILTYIIVMVQFLNA